MNVKSGFLTSRRLKSKLALIQAIGRVFWLPGKVPFDPVSGICLNVSMSVFDKSNIYHIPKSTLVNDEIDSAHVACDQHHTRISCASIKIAKRQKCRKLSQAQVKALRENVTYGTELWGICVLHT